MARGKWRVARGVARGAYARERALAGAGPAGRRRRRRRRRRCHRRPSTARQQLRLTASAPLRLRPIFGVAQISYIGQSTTAAGQAAGDVVIHRHKNVDTQLSTGDYKTIIPGASWGGYGRVAKAACSMDGSGYWVLGGDATGSQPVRYVANAATNGGTQASVVVNAGFAASGANLNGCQLMAANATSGLPKAMYFEGTLSSYGYVLSASNAAEDWTTTMTIPPTTAWQYFNGNPYYGKQVISNRARTRFFVTEPFNCGYGTCTGIWKCDGAPGVCGSPAGPDTYSFWSQDYLVTGGIALSPDDTKLFYTTAKQVWWISAVGALAGPATPVGAPLAGAAQYRGISWAPVTPTCGAGNGGMCCTPGMPGYYCAGGVLPLLPCAAGTVSLLGGGGTGSCTACAAGSYSLSLRACAACSPGISCPGTGNSVNTAPCAKGFYCPGGVAPIACS